MVLQPQGVLGSAPYIAQARQCIRQGHAQVQAIGLRLDQRCKQPGCVGILTCSHQQAGLRLPTLLDRIGRGCWCWQLQWLARHAHGFGQVAGLALLFDESLAVGGVERYKARFLLDAPAR